MKKLFKFDTRIGRGSFIAPGRVCDGCPRIAFANSAIEVSRRAAQRRRRAGPSGSTRRDESFDYRKTYDFYSQRKAIYKIGGPAL